MPPSLADRVRHILEAINDIEAALVGIGSDQLAANRMLRAGIERKLEVISEASRHIPEEVKASEPDIPWQRMADFGNRVRHAYHDVDIDVVWKIVRHDIRPLKIFITLVIADSKK
jgi:uncharacterized protein with HEPN domain